MLRSSRAQPKPEAPGSKSTPGWQPNLRQEARQNQSPRNRFWQFQLSLGILPFAASCFSQNWAMSVPLSQLFVATAQSQSQLVLQLVKVLKFPLYVGQLFLQPALHRRTSLQAISSQSQEPSDLTELESQALHATDEGQRLDIAFAVPPEASLCPGRSLKQTVTLVEPNRVDAEADNLCDDPNLHRLRSSQRSYTLEYSPESSPYSSVERLRGAPSARVETLGKATLRSSKSAKFVNSDRCEVSRSQLLTRQARPYKPSV